MDMITVRGPGGICRVSKEQAEKMCQLDGFEIVTEVSEQPIVPSENMEISELRVMAEGLDITVDADATKEQIIELIKSVRD